MDKFCDKCIVRECDKCKAGSGNTVSDKIKNEITKSLTHFLISDKRIPDEIIIKVRYPQSTAKLELKLDTINGALKEEQEKYNG